jgi:hypothetical protein
MITFSFLPNLLKSKERRKQSQLNHTLTTESHPPLNINEGLYGQYFTQTMELKVGTDGSQDESLKRCRTLGEIFDSEKGRG